MKDNGFIGSLFEDDYMVRSLGGIVQQPDIALMELVANAWDAGATSVKIFIPEKIGDRLTIEDNGTGMSLDDFKNRWMKLRYNRIKHQGNKVTFPPGIQSTRFAYGHNGIGRHGLLCFNSKEYFVVTTNEGKQLTLTVSTEQEREPIAVINQQEKDVKTSEHGTRLEVVVEQNLPNIERIRNIIASKFLHDPQFCIEINRTSLPLEKLDGFMDEKTLNVEGTTISMSAKFFDSLRVTRKSIYQGIAFWQGGRLVGEPSWILGQEAILDGRTKIARRYTVVISTNDLSEEVEEDWSAFKRTDTMQKVYGVVSKYVNSKFAEIAQNSAAETKANIRQEFKEKLKDASPLMLYEIDEVIDNITISSPTANQESVSVAVEALINLEKSKSGRELLAKLSLIDNADIDDLNRLLDKWTVKDALVVLDEIDNRLKIIEAIRKLSDDSTIDELHILHPLITDSRWLFGPEYDSAEYTSNRQLQTVIGKILKDKIVKIDGINYKKRPDIVSLSNATMSVTGTQEFELLSTIPKILVIELKRGGYKITRDERNQAQGYAEDLLASFPAAAINAFVVGHDIADNVQRISKVGDTDAAKVYVSTFSQLVDTAEKRLFGLRNKLSSRYDDIPGMELYAQTQLSFRG
ncbi:MAG: ATP-binding protein [Mediterranea sp.]|jgi:hypothetical protein|nr:ATP-binding protein [Mediterranea sp.]